MFRWLADLIIDYAKKRPYRKGHLLHPDGSLYMGRYSLFETKWLSCRVHHIATEDHACVHHDHPWWFLSCVLRGFYVEERPVDPCRPVFRGTPPTELNEWGTRDTGTWAFRRATDRHYISYVSVEECWTLFICGSLRQWWGFYTPEGKVYWRDYLREHPRKEQTDAT